MRQTFLREVSDFPPNERTLVKLPSREAPGSPLYFFQQQGGSAEPRSSLGRAGAAPGLLPLPYVLLRAPAEKALSSGSPTQPAPKRLLGVRSALRAAGQCPPSIPPVRPVPLSTKLCGVCRLSPARTPALSPFGPVAFHRVSIVRLIAAFTCKNLFCEYADSQNSSESECRKQRFKPAGAPAQPGEDPRVSLQLGALTGAGILSTPTPRRGRGCPAASGTVTQRRRSPHALPQMPPCATVRQQGSAIAAAKRCLEGG